MVPEAGLRDLVNTECSWGGGFGRLGMYGSDGLRWFRRVGESRS